VPRLKFGGNRIAGLRQPVQFFDHGRDARTTRTREHGIAAAATASIEEINQRKPMAKQNWLNKQLDQASTVVRSWSEWKRETIKSQIADIAPGGTSANHQEQVPSEYGTRKDGAPDRRTTLGRSQPYPEARDATRRVPEMTQAMIEAGIRAYGSDDDRSTPEKVLDIWQAMNEAHDRPAETARHPKPLRADGARLQAEAKDNSRAPLFVGELY